MGPESHEGQPVAYAPLHFALQLYVFILVLIMNNDLCKYTDDINKFSIIMNNDETKIEF